MVAASRVPVRQFESGQQIVHARDDPEHLRQRHERLVHQAGQGNQQRLDDLRGRIAARRRSHRAQRSVAAPRMDHDLGPAGVGDSHRSGLVVDRPEVYRRVAKRDPPRGSELRQCHRRAVRAGKVVDADRGRVCNSRSVGLVDPEDVLLPPLFALPPVAIVEMGGSSGHVDEARRAIRRGAEPTAKRIRRERNQPPVPSDGAIPGDSGESRGSSNRQ